MRLVAGGSVAWYATSSLVITSVPEARKSVLDRNPAFPALATTQLPIIQHYPDFLLLPMYNYILDFPYQHPTHSLLQAHGIIRRLPSPFRPPQCTTVQHKIVQQKSQIIEVGNSNSATQWSALIFPADGTSVRLILYSIKQKSKGDGSVDFYDYLLDLRPWLEPAFLE